MSRRKFRNTTLVILVLFLFLLTFPVLSISEPQDIKGSYLVSESEKFKIALDNSDVQSFKIIIDESLLELDRNEIEFIRDEDHPELTRLDISNFVVFLSNLFPDSQSVLIDQNLVKNCKNIQIKTIINFEKLLTKLQESLNNNGTINIDSSEIQNLTNEVIYLEDKCKEYSKKRSQIETLLSKIGIQNFDFDNFFEFRIDQTGYAFWTTDSEALSKTIGSSNKLIIQDAVEGELFTKDGKTFVTRPSQIGVQINPELSASKINNWLNNPKLNLEFSESNTNPEKNVSLNDGYDFTKLMGVGKTRLPIIKDGLPNPSLTYAQGGLHSVDLTFIEPGATFSYIKTIEPRNGYTSLGYRILSGICNSTTTIFRAVLESGFEVTQRRAHSYNVPHYDWGYPLNVVDASYYTNPEIDFKFKNDTDYPILLKFESERPGDGFQYHYVKFYSSQEAKTRNVKIDNFRKWDEKSQNRFKGAFDRKVYENDILIREETFESNYWNVF